MSDREPSAPEVLCHVEGGIATLTLNRPERLNPMTLVQQRALIDALARLGGDRAVRALVLTGTGRAFCSGADLSGMEAAAAEGGTVGTWLGRAMREVTAPLVQALRAFPRPTLVALNGPAVGGGVGLALAADVVIAARSSYFLLPFVPKLGLVPDVGSSWVLPRRIGTARTMALALLGDRLGAERAAEWGLVWQCVEDADLSAAVAAAAARLAELPPEAVLAARQACDAAGTNTLAEQLELEAALQSRLGDRPAFDEGVRAFLEKRAPRFEA